jgi:hypothetical protein
MDENFNLSQHPVDTDRELVERVIAPAGRQALAQIAGHDTLDSPIDFQEPIVSTQAQYRSNGNRQAERRQQAQHEGPPNDFRKLGDLINVPTDHKNFTFGSGRAASRTCWISRPPSPIRTTAALIGTSGARPDGRLSTLPARR